MASILPRPQCVNMYQVFKLVYSRSVTMLEWKKHFKGTCVGPTFDRRWVDIGHAMSAQRRYDVGLMSPADVGPTSDRRQSEYLNIIIKTNRNVPQRNAMIIFVPKEIK